jgi:hypothetical protein
MKDQETEVGRILKEWCHQEMGDYYRDFKGGREQRYSKT